MLTVQRHYRYNQGLLYMACALTYGACPCCAKVSMLSRRAQIGQIKSAITANLPEPVLGRVSEWQAIRSRDGEGRQSHRQLYPRPASRPPSPFDVIGSAD